MAIVQKLIRWFIFSVAVALLPLIFHALQLITRGKSASLSAVTSHGELLIVSVALAAAAIGNIIGNKNMTLSIPKLLSAGFCMLMLLLSSFYYADISACRISGQPIEDNVIACVSLISYIFTFICSACCIVLSEVE